MKNKMQNIISEKMKKYLRENNFSYNHLLGMGVHNVIYRQGAIFIFDGIEGKKAKIRTPKTQKIHYCNLLDLYPSYNSFKKITGVEFVNL